jgi:hypothetical protein
MPAEKLEHWRLAEVNSKVERLGREMNRLEAEQRSLAKARSKACWRRRYLRLAQALRSPKASWELWPTGVLVVGPLLGGAAMLIVASVLIDSLGIILAAFLAGVALAAPVLATLLFRPADADLPASMADAESAHRQADERWQASVGELAAAQDESRALMDERRELMASGKVQRAALLQRRWKTMPEPEWEDFVVEVCRTLGATVERTPRSTEPGATLLVRFGDRRVAVLTHGTERTINSKTVQQSLASKERHGCDSCAVVVNRRFTGAAQDYAHRHGCTLVGIDQFPDFVMGTLEF